MKVLLLLLGFLVTPLLGDETVVDITKGGETYSFWGEFVNMVFMLAFVIVLIVGSVWLLKKLMQSRVKALNHSNGIKILERRPLNQKASLYLVDVLGKGLIISESQAGIQLISEFPESVDIEELLDQLQETKKPRPSFRDILSNKMKTMSSQKNA